MPETQHCTSKGSDEETCKLVNVDVNNIHWRHFVLVSYDFICLQKKVDSFKKSEEWQVRVSKI